MDARADFHYQAVVSLESLPELIVDEDLGVSRLYTDGQRAKLIRCEQAGLSRSLLIFASGDCAVILCDSLGGRLLLGFEITEG